MTPAVDPQTDDISFLEQFRDLIDRVLQPLGYAPPQMENVPLDSSPEASALRREYAQQTPRAEMLMRSVGHTVTMAVEQFGRRQHQALLAIPLHNELVIRVFSRDITEHLDATIGALRLRASTPKSEQASVPGLAKNRQSLFVAMPFDEVSDPHLVDVYDTIKRVASDLGLETIRVDKEQSNAPLTPRIEQHIRESQFMVADLTHERPSVYYEGGFAAGIGRYPAYIARDGTVLHFDAHDFNVMFFKNQSELAAKLTGRLKGLIEALPPSR